MSSESKPVTTSGVGRSTPRRRRLLRWTLGTGGALVVATAAIGALHTSWGRPLLARLGGCPAMRASAKDVNALRLRGMAGTVDGARPARLRPALGFALDRATPADVLGWAAREHVSCAEKKRGLLALHCASVPRSRLPSAGQGTAMIEDLAFTFDPSNRLVSVDAFTRQLPEDTASAAYASSSAGLMASLGDPSDQAGGDSAKTVPLFGASRRRYRFSDYVAILSLARLPNGLAVREQYLSGS